MQLFVALKKFLCIFVSLLTFAPWYFKFPDFPRLPLTAGTM